MAFDMLPPDVTDRDLQPDQEGATRWTAKPENANHE